MNNQICKIHNEPAIYCEQDEEQKLLFYCKFYSKYEQQLTKESQSAFEFIFNQKVLKLQEFAVKIDVYTSQISLKLQKIRQQVDENIQNLLEKRNSLKIQINDIKDLQQNQIDEQYNSINNQLIKIQELFYNELKDLEISSYLDQLYQSLKNFQIETNYNVKGQVNIQKNIEINKRFDFRLIQQSSHKQNENCRAIAFNKDSTVMIAGCGESIKVFEFMNDILREVQQLNQHLDYVNNLYFMKKSDQFVSGSYDKTIIIWQQNQDKYWQVNQVLKSHTSYVLCITINQHEEMLVSGSYDKTINIWYKQSNSWTSKQSIDCQSQIYSVSLSVSEDKLVASGDNKQILVMQFYGKEWIIKQKIQVEQLGYRLCFISKSQFVFQPIDRQYLLIFDYDAKDQTFKKVHQLGYSNKTIDNFDLFPICFNPIIRLILVKNGEYVQLIKFSQNGEFKVEQQIKYQTDGIYGSITDDGRYLATWDSQSREIQIRKFEY